MKSRYPSPSAAARTIEGAAGCSFAINSRIGRVLMNSDPSTSSVAPLRSLTTTEITRPFALRTATTSSPNRTGWPAAARRDATASHICPAQPVPRPPRAAPRLRAAGRGPVLLDPRARGEGPGGVTGDPAAHGLERARDAPDRPGILVRRRYRGAVPRRLVGGPQSGGPGA